MVATYDARDVFIEEGGYGARIAVGDDGIVEMSMRARPVFGRPGSGAGWFASSATCAPPAAPPRCSCSRPPRSAPAAHRAVGPASSGPARTVPACRRSDRADLEPGCARTGRGTCPPMRYQALACDYDGTIAERGVVAPATRAALARLRERPARRAGHRPRCSTTCSASARTGRSSTRSSPRTAAVYLPARARGAPARAAAADALRRAAARRAA